MTHLPATLIVSWSLMRFLINTQSLSLLAFQSETATKHFSRYKTLGDIASVCVAMSFNLSEWYLLLVLVAIGYVVSKALSFIMMLAFFRHIDRNADKSSPLKPVVVIGAILWPVCAFWAFQVISRLD